MEKYILSFSITSKMLTLATEIAEKTGQITSYRSFETNSYLRRNNRIRSIHSSLAIEANCYHKHRHKLEKNLIVMIPVVK